MYFSFSNSFLRYNANLTMTRGKGTRRILLAHVESSKKLNSKVRIDHMIHVVSVGRHGSRFAQLTVELNTIFAQNVTRYPNLPPMSGFDHHMVIPSCFLQATTILVSSVSLFSISVVLQKDDNISL